MTIQQSLTKMQKITTIIIPSENSTSHFSLVGLLVNPAISTSPAVRNFSRHGSPSVRFAAGSLMLQLGEFRL